MTRRDDSFLVVTDAEILPRSAPDLPGTLRSQHLYKSLSLLVATMAGLKVPPSLLLLALRRDAISEFVQSWGTPLMIRVDYRDRPKGKPLGGIPLYEIDTMVRVSEDLLGRGYLPLFHQYFDRFADLFSAGILFGDDDDSADVEVVGRGFDASDLRLGKTSPHETFRLSLATGRSQRLSLISAEGYRRERRARQSFVRWLESYSSHVNASGKLASDTHEPPHSLDITRPSIPVSYEELPEEPLAELAKISNTIRSSVLSQLPGSKTYVASLSYLPNEGWVLWDVYGQWYWR